MSKYGLLMNKMTSPNIENLHLVKVADSPDELKGWYEAQKQEPWRDGHWGKTWPKGSELEWFNPVHNLDKLNEYWGGIWEVPDEAETQVGQLVVWK